MSGEDLERSVLEAKERDELHTIAGALGLKLSSRTKKADLVDSILRATGVQTDATNGAVKTENKGKGESKEKVEKNEKVENLPESAVDQPEVAAPVEESTIDSAIADAIASISEPEPQASEPEAKPTEASAAASETQGQGTAGPSQNRYDSDQSGRRSRRRRGRDRDRIGAGYDQQAQQADAAFQGEPIDVTGILELRPEGFGFLRATGYLPGPEDVYVSTSQVRKFGLRPGDHVVGSARPASSQEKFPALLQIETVSGLSADDARSRPRFDTLTPLFPDMRLKLELGDPKDPANITGRIIDLLCPIGKGQRGLIVSPPKAGKTTIMKHIAKAIEANHPEVDLMILLVDERPEEVTDMRRFTSSAEVIGSTFDRPSEEHTHVAELAIEVAKRRVEVGRDVVIILDGITRLSRAYNLAAPATGRIMSGGVDSGALYPPKKFFGAARNVEEGGSLTILATALVETGSTMDTVIFEEFKGTGNMELRLDRRLAERRMYPAIDVTASSTRHEELLLDRHELRLVWQLRRVLVALSQDGSGHKGYELLLEKMKASKTNEDFLDDIAKSPTSGV